MHEQRGKLKKKKEEYTEKPRLVSRLHRSQACDWEFTWLPSAHWPSASCPRGSPVPPSRGTRPLARP